MWHPNLTKPDWTDKNGFLFLQHAPIYHVFFQIDGFNTEFVHQEDCRAYRAGSEQLQICARDYYNDVNQTAVLLSKSLIKKI
jgi:hypothetical protein